METLFTDLTAELVAIKRLAPQPTVASWPVGQVFEQRSERSDYELLYAVAAAVKTLSDLMVALEARVTALE